MLQMQGSNDDGAITAGIHKNQYMLADTQPTCRTMHRLPTYNCHASQRRRQCLLRTLLLSSLFVSPACTLSQLSRFRQAASESALSKVQWLGSRLAASPERKEQKEQQVWDALANLEKDSTFVTSDGSLCDACFAGSNASNCLTLQCSSSILWQARPPNYQPSSWLYLPAVFCPWQSLPWFLGRT